MTKKILAKFKVDSVELFENGKTLKLSPVYGKVGDNEGFWKYTPSGQLIMQVVNPEIEMNPGDEYFIEFTKNENKQVEP